MSLQVNVLSDNIRLLHTQKELKRSLKNQRKTSVLESLLNK